MGDDMYHLPRFALRIWLEGCVRDWEFVVFLTKALAEDI
jgi:hypothetical protein